MSQYSAVTTSKSRHTGSAPDTLACSVKLPSVPVSVASSSTGYHPSSSCSGDVDEFIAAKAPPFFEIRIMDASTVNAVSGVLPFVPSRNGPNGTEAAVLCLSSTAIYAALLIR